MIKTQTKQITTLEIIIEAFDKYPMPQAREILYDRIGARLQIKGIIEKVVRRDGLKLVVKPNGLAKPFMIFADFNNEKQREMVKQEKLRKGSQIVFTGDFCTAGYCAATLENCQLLSHQR